MSGNDGGLGVVVVHYGAPETTRRCLRSIVDDRSTVRRNIMVVDNSAGTPDSLARADLPPGVSTLAAQDNPGYGASANRGVDALRRRMDSSRGWVVLNHDVTLSPGFLDAAFAALDGSVGAAGGPIRLDRPDGPLWYAGGRFRRLTGTVVQSRSPADADRPRDVGFVPGTAIAVSRRAWDEVGGFDPGFFLYHEDLDLCLRLRRAGWRLRFEPGMEVVHHLGGATGSGERSAFYLEEMAATRLRPHRSRLYRLYLAALHTPYALLRALMLRLGDRRDGAARARALLAGHRRALRDLFD
jgi:GT2 family glycosyltransferase